MKRIALQFLKEMEEIVEPTSPAQTRANSRIHSRAHSRTATGSASFANFSIPERQPLLSRAVAAVESSYEEEVLGPVDRDRPVAGGTVLGIHNLAIVLPQFIVCRLSSFDPFPRNGSHSNCVFLGFTRYKPYLQDR